MIFNSFSLQLDCMMSSDCGPEISLTLNTTKAQKQSLWPSGWPTANTDNAADSPPTGNSVDVVPHVPDVFLLLLWFVCRRDIKKHPLNKQLVVLDISLCSNCPPPNPPIPPAPPTPLFKNTRCYCWPTDSGKTVVFPDECVQLRCDNGC